MPVHPWWLEVCSPCNPVLLFYIEHLCLGDKLEISVALSFLLLSDQPGQNLVPSSSVFMTMLTTTIWKQVIGRYGCAAAGKANLEGIFTQQYRPGQSKSGQADYKEHIRKSCEADICGTAGRRLHKYTLLPADSICH